MKKKNGFALTALIVFTAIGLSAIAASVYMVADSFILTSKTSLSEEVYRLALSGAEEARYQRLRNPSDAVTPYQGGSLIINGTTVTVQITGDQILSTAQKYGIMKQVTTTL